MVGRSILQYKITEKLGEGGMGVVYKAEDTQLRRTVALKFLPRETLDEEEVKARLIREAQAAAALDHPNICQVFGIHEEDGETFIAMAYIDGPSLAERIKERPLPLGEALGITIQIAEALHAADEKGIVHRDIKPQNIMLTAKGQVKILDFGLASLAGRSKLTKSGTVLGTPAYMAPEQLEAGQVDRRADIWALGCVLYEMLTQRSPFEADYEQAIGYGILNEDPEPVTALRSGLPTELDRLLGKALAKDRAERYQHADEMLADLRILQKQSGARKMPSGRSTVAATASVADELPLGPVTAQPSSRRVERVLLAVLGIALLGTLAVHFTQTQEVATQRPLLRFSFPADGVAREGAARISPDGKHIAYALESDGERTLWLRSLDSESARSMAGTVGAADAFWSPDSLSIGFATDSELKRIAIDGSDPIILCELPADVLSFDGATWSPDGSRIVFSSGLQLYEVAARGGEPKLLSGLGHAERPLLLHPHFLPVYAPSILVYTAAASGSDRVLALKNFETGESWELSPGAAPFYSTDGYLIHGAVRDGDAGLWALPFSLASLEPTGESFPLSAIGHMPTVSKDGTLAFVDQPQRGLEALVWRNRSGEILERVGQLQLDMAQPSISPDGRFVAVGSSESGNDDIWIHDLTRSTKTRLTFSTSGEVAPTWSPSGREVAYVIAGGRRLMAKATDGTSEATVLVDGGTGLNNPDWSRDSRYLAYQQVREGGEPDIGYLNLTADRDSSQPAASPTTSSRNGRVPKLSPDGRFVAYVSGESGQLEVYVRPFPDGNGRWQISVDGGAQPGWRGDGAELYYVEDTALMATTVSTERGFTLTQPQKLFETADLLSNTARSTYDVSADGQRFLMITPVPDDGSAPPTVRVVQSWAEEFRDREQ